MAISEPFTPRSVNSVHAEFELTIAVQTSSSNSSNDKNDNDVRLLLVQRIW